MILKVNHLTKSFDLEDQNIMALREINFGVEKGEFFTIIGPSGCGKSTLLRILANLIPKTAGEIIWEEHPTLGFVFQSYALFPYLTVFQNIEFGLKMNGLKKYQRSKIVKNLINEVGLMGFEDKHPKELSGGMRQRVGIARSLAIDPNVLLLDEPFSSLDEFTAETLRSLLLDIWRKRKMTVILITHSIKEAIYLSDKIAVLSSPPGHIIKILDDKLKRPRNMRSQEFFDLEDKLSSRYPGKD